MVGWTSATNMDTHPIDLPPIFRKTDPLFLIGGRFLVPAIVGHITIGFMGIIGSLIVAWLASVIIGSKFRARTINKSKDHNRPSALSFTATTESELITEYAKHILADTTLSAMHIHKELAIPEKNKNESWIEMTIFAAVLVVRLMPASTPKQEALRIAIRVVEHVSHSISHSIAGRAMTEDERRELSGRFSRSWKQFGNLPFRRSDEESRGTYVWAEPDARPS